MTFFGSRFAPGHLCLAISQAVLCAHANGRNGSPLGVGAGNNGEIVKTVSDVLGGNQARRWHGQPEQVTGTRKGHYRLPSGLDSGHHARPDTDTAHSQNNNIIMQNKSLFI